MYLLAALLLGAPVLTPALAAVVAPDLALLQEQTRVKAESEMRIQHDVLDTMLGKGKAAAFVDVEMEVKAESQESTRTGMGVAEKYKEKAPAPRGGMQTTFVLPGIPKPKTITAQQNPEKPEQSQAQQAQQMKGVDEQRFSVKPIFKRLQVTVIHDDGVLKDKKARDVVRDRIKDAMSHYQKLGDDQIDFRPTQFDKPPLVDWKEDLKKPSVYLPLLYALLLLLFLSFLFGPLARFFRQYVAALREKPAAEVNVESKLDTGEDEDGSGDGTEESESAAALDVMMGRKPDDAPPPPPEEEEVEDAMKKFEPFTYITEENFKRLGNLFLVRGDEPWLIAVVLSYMKSDLARATLTALPLELQAKVAIEALKLRQVTREQLMAIDADIKESVDFVVGGMERLTQLLDEADTMTRANILEYLKNEKPEVYQRVRKFIMSFEDVVGFPDRDMQVIVRELKTESMAKALQGAAPDILNKFLSNMSSGAASLLKESIEYASGLSAGQVEDERSKIMDVVKVLEKEGKVSVRESRGGAFSGFTEEVASDRGAKYEPRTRAAEQAVAQLLSAGSGPAVGGGAAAHAAAPVALPPAALATPAQASQAQTYFSAGVQSHDAGQFPQAAQYLEYALSQDPSLWQARQYLGTCYVQMGRQREAIAEFEAVLVKNPDPGLRQWVDGMKAQAI